MFLQALVSRCLSFASPQTPSSRKLSLGIGLFSTLALAVLAALIAPLPAHAQQEWTWVSGSDLPNQKGVYTSPATPGARAQAAKWIDGNGNLWLFGGEGLDSAGNAGPLNDLWEFTPSNSQWIWQGGKSTLRQVSPYYVGWPGVYGTLGSPAPGNIPGSRYAPSTWTDQSGNLWLFGGQGYDASASGYGTEGFLNDLWEYSTSLKEWTWWGGSQGVNQLGNFGNNGWPGSRSDTASWTDLNGNLWLFGGYGYVQDSDPYESGPTFGNENDLWEFSVASKQWTFVSGAETIPNNGGGWAGIYGSLGEAGVGYTPGGRRDAATWLDKSGNLWLFGGYGPDSTGNQGAYSTGNEGDLNELWMFNPETEEWAWMGGSNTVTEYGNQGGGAPGNYGPEGTPGLSYFPSGRQYSVAWVDPAGNVWLFGGFGLDSATNFGYLDDLWEYNPVSKEWTFANGNSTVPPGYGGWPGIYGSLGAPSGFDLPGSRTYEASWADGQGNLWLFGGNGFYGTSNQGGFNDLWKWNTARTANLAKTGGDSQGTPIGTSFAQDLQVTVTDNNGDPLSGVTVTFGTPSSGAGGTFAGGVNTAVTNSSGIATAPAFTANTTLGSYQVFASAAGSNVVYFSLANEYFASIVSVTPNSGFGLTQQFSIVTQQNGANSIGEVWMLIGAQAGAANSCHMVYAASANILSLMNDAGNSWGTGGQPGSSGTLSNSQCSIGLASTTIARNGNQLTVTPTITFTSAYEGAKNIYVAVQDSKGHNTGLVKVGTWTAGLGAEAPPYIVSVYPNAGYGKALQFSFVGASPVGAGNLEAIYMLIAGIAVQPTNNCYMKYLPHTNMFYLAANNGTFGTGGQPGSSTTLSNSQCSVNLATTTTTASGTELTVSPTVSALGSFTGNLTIYMTAVDAVGKSTGNLKRGTWQAY